MKTRRYIPSAVRVVRHRVHLAQYVLHVCMYVAHETGARDKRVGVLREGGGRRGGAVGGR